MQLVELVVEPDAVVVGRHQPEVRAELVVVQQLLLVLERRELRHLERRELRDRAVDRGLPAVDEHVPVLVVEADPRQEHLEPLLDLGRVADLVRRDVDVAVDDAVLDAEHGRDLEDAALVEADREVARLGRDHVEGRHRLREVHAVVEPEALLLGLAPLGIEEEVVRIHLLPALGARRASGTSNGLRNFVSARGSVIRTPGRTRCGERTGLPVRGGDGRAGLLASEAATLSRSTERSAMGSPLLAEYEEQGFVFCPDVLSAAEVGVLTAELDQVLASEADGRRVILEADGVTPRTVVNPHLYRDAYARLVRHPALLATVEELLGEQVYALQMGVNCKAAFAGDVWFWHQDYPAYLEDDHIPAPRMVNALIFLDEVTTLNSPLMLVPGSHRYTGEMPEVSDQGTSYTFRYSGVATDRAASGRGRDRGADRGGRLRDLHARQHAARLDREPLAVVAASRHADVQCDLEQGNEPERAPRAHRPATIGTCRRSHRSAAIACSRDRAFAATDAYADARPLWAEIDLGAITHNLALVRERAGRPVRVIAAAQGECLRPRRRRGCAAARVGRRRRRRHRESRRRARRPARRLLAADPDVRIGAARRARGRSSRTV